MVSHNRVVYTQRLTELLQVVAAPLMQVMEEEIQVAKKHLAELNSEKEQLIAALQTTGDSRDIQPT